MPKHLSAGQKGSTAREHLQGLETGGRDLFEAPTGAGTVTAPAGGSPTLSSLLSLRWGSPRGSAWSCFPIPTFYFWNFHSEEISKHVDHALSHSLLQDGRKRAPAWVSKDR